MTTACVLARVGGGAYIAALGFLGGGWRFHGDAFSAGLFPFTLLL